MLYSGPWGRRPEIPGGRLGPAQNAHQTLPGKLTGWAVINGFPLIIGYLGGADRNLIIIITVSTSLISSIGIHHLVNFVSLIGEKTILGFIGGSLGRNFMLPDSILGAPSYANESWQRAIPSVIVGFTSLLIFEIKRDLQFLKPALGSTFIVSVLGLHLIVDSIAQILSALSYGLSCKFYFVQAQNLPHQGNGRGLNPPNTYFGGIIYPGVSGVGVLLINYFFAPNPLYGSLMIVPLVGLRKIGIISLASLAVITRYPLKAAFVNLKAVYRIINLLMCRVYKPFTSLGRLVSNVGITYVASRVIDSTLPSILPDTGEPINKAIKTICISIAFTVSTTITKWISNCIRKYQTGFKNPERFVLLPAEIKLITDSLSQSFLAAENKFSAVILAANHAFYEAIQKLKHESYTYRFSRFFCYSNAERNLKKMHTQFKAGQIRWEIYDEENPPHASILPGTEFDFYVYLEGSKTIIAIPDGYLIPKAHQEKVCELVFES